jgi:hypothetical protein
MVAFAGVAIHEAAKSPCAKGRFAVNAELAGI